MKTAGWWLGASLLIWGANQLGWWQASIAVGAVLALVLPRISRAVWIGFLAGAVGWAIPLVTAAMSDAVVFQMAGVLAGILGLGKGLAGVALVLPSLVGGLLALCGAWIVGTVKAAVFPAQQSVVSKQPARVNATLNA